jgi:hypothetical protein
MVVVIFNQAAIDVPEARRRCLVAVLGGGGAVHFSSPVCIV